ncbi:beige/beach-related [Anaeramoeba ignava]|uniref:Beige/beach-related n=1 Tax=Anaeramoeba ignava TaxID=1746090 RepID=A0A9Q0L898_ANAIG|nr:beige/beach-related [Anaeramoeba ignava]
MLEKSTKKRKFGSFRNWIDKDFVSERRKYGNEVVQFSIGIPDENSENMKQIILLMNLFSNFKFFLLFGKYCTYDQNVFRSGIQNIIHFLFGRIENLDMNVVEELMQFSQYLQSLVESIEIEVSHSRKTELLYVILSLLFTLLYEVEEYLQKDEKKNEEKQEQIKLQKIRLTKRKIIIEVLKLIFYKYYSLIQKKFTDPNGNSILNSEPSSFLLFQKNKEYEDFMELFQTEKWKNAVQQHFNSVEEKFRKELEIHWTIIAQERIAKTEGVKQEYQVIQENQEKQKQQKSDEILNQLLSTLVKESELNLKKYIDEKNKTKINARRKWRLMFRNLTSERGAWRQEKNHEEAHWKVDKTSGFSNQRRKLKRNYKFDMHMRACVRRDEGSKEYLTTILQNYDRTEMEKLRSETTLKILEMKSLIDNVNGKERLNETKIEFDDMMMIKESLKENNSKTIIYRTSCELVSLTGSISGMLEITTVSLDFYGKYNPYLKKGDLNEKLKEDEKMIEMTKYISWNLNEMKEMMKRRFNLRRCAIEFFLINKKSFLINFPNAKIADQVYNEISSMKLPNLIRYETGSFSEILKKSKITKKWQHYEMTNFEYLMELNIISGRTFNDISQYPVFPWILVDFSSEKIDLDDISVYRDLSKPIGALNEKRLKDFIQRYHDLSRIDDSIPPFHYGSHYSNQGGVLFYLIRIEPFTSLFIEMQGGKFDIADRVFHSLPTTWESCLTSQSDVKELIPEFYFFPEFLENSNNFNLGKKQTGELIGNVILPPWAKTPDEYIWMNRKALESEYVSQHLNEWIDLIFGYKQQGEEAVKAYNVFHYLTYENSIEIDSIQNEHQKQSIEEQVRYFGQTPTQIFKKPHPKRLSLSEVNASPFYWEIDAKTKFRSSCITLTKSKILFVNFKTKLIVFDKNRYLHFIRNFMNQPGINQTKAKHSPSLAISKSSYFPSRTFSQTNSNEKLESGFSSQTPQLKRKTLDLINPTTESKDDQYYSQISMETSIKKSTQRIGVSFAFGITQFSICFAVTKNEKNIIICGYWDNSFKIYNTETFKLKQSISHHKDIVTCLALDDDLLVTGSRDTTVIVWKLQVTKGKVLEKPMHILYGHNDEVSCVDVNYQLDVVVSGSLDGTCNIQTAQLGSYVRSFFLHESKRISPSMIKIINNGYILIYSNKDLSIYLFSINAKLLKIVDTSQIIHSWITSNNSQYLFTGSQQGVIQIRQIIDLKLVSHFEVKNSIRFLSFLGNEKNLLAGLESGELLFGKFF